MLELLCGFVVSLLTDPEFLATLLAGDAGPHNTHPGQHGTGQFGGSV